MYGVFANSTKRHRQNLRISHENQINEPDSEESALPVYFRVFNFYRRLIQKLRGHKSREGDGYKEQLSSKNGWWGYPAGGTVNAPTNLHAENINTTPPWPSFKPWSLRHITPNSGWETLEGGRCQMPMAAHDNNTDK